MTDQPNPYAPWKPFKPPFHVIGDRHNLIVDSHNEVGTWTMLKGIGVPSNIMQRIVDLLNRDAEQARQSLPAPELDPVRRLIVKIGNRPAGKSSLEHLADCGAALVANLPALTALLIDHEYCNSAHMRAHLKELSDEWVEMKVEVARLREENAQLIAAVAELQLHVKEITKRIGQEHDMYETLESTHMKLLAEVARLREESV